MSWNLAPPPPEEMAAIVAALEVCWPKPVARAADDLGARTPPWRWSGRWWGPSHARGGAAARRRPWRA